jgi:hypothetical protein
VTVDDSEPLRYRLLTGADDRAFCERISAALDDGYELHGSPAITTRPDGTVVCAQAVVRARPGAGPGAGPGA